MRLKLSHSTMSLWEQRDYERALRALFGEWSEPTEAMRYGLERHKEWELEVQRTGRLPEVFGGGELTSGRPLTEQYYRVQVLDWLWLSGVIDLQDGTTLYDYKTGKQSAVSYAAGKQHETYKLLVPEAKLFRYLCFNQHQGGKITTSFVHLTDKTAERAFNRLITTAGEIRDYLEANGMADFDNVDRSHRNV